MTAIDVVSTKARRLNVNDLSVLVKGSVFQTLHYAEEILCSSAVAEGSDSDSPADLLVDIGSQGQLVLEWHRPEHKKPWLFSLDYSADVSKIRSFPAPKQGAFNQALGKKSHTILDATGGWGGDAFLMATQGYVVHILERNSVMALVLREAFERLDRSLSSLGLPVVAPTVRFADGINAIEKAHADVDDQFDCVYLDPMFPPKRKKSAATNKRMQLLHSLVGPDLDAGELLTSALSSGIKRVSVKRPDYAAPLIDPPTQQFSSKLVHYDVYLPH